MSLSVGIVGLPNAGKSTLFNALLGRQVADTAPYPFCTIEPNVGVVEVPDARLDKVAEAVRPEKKIPAVIKFIDIAGLVKGAHQGEGLGNEFLAQIREVDVILHLVRAFDASSVDRAGSVDPQTDEGVVETELVLKDLETIQKVQSAIRRPADKVQNPERGDVLEKVSRVLGEGRAASEANLSAGEISKIADLNLLTLKPRLVVLNVAESAIVAGSKAISLCAKLEEDLSAFSLPERQKYLQGVGVSEAALDRVLSICYNLLGLITFFTIKGGTIAQAWPLKGGSTASEAARLVHSDFARDFIRAEVLPFSDLVVCGSWAGAKEGGLVAVRGRDYVIRDGDVVEIKV